MKNLHLLAISVGMAIGSAAMAEPSVTLYGILDVAVFAEILLRLMLSMAFKAAYGVSVMRRVVIVLLIDVSRKLDGRRFSVALDTSSVLRSLH